MAIVLLAVNRNFSKLIKIFNIYLFLNFQRHLYKFEIVERGIRQKDNKSKNEQPPLFVFNKVSYF